MVVLRVIKSPWAQVNLGSGRDVTDEVADAGEPPRIEWLGGSFIEIQFARSGH
ncbi:MAG: hypothetical protein M3O61_16150 [Gemmatimonadota bacterium]|nr:hypothetical protein [Gemmatimonadota bacterium]